MSKRVKTSNLHSGYAIGGSKLRGRNMNACREELHRKNKLISSPASRREGATQLGLHACMLAFVE